MREEERKEIRRRVGMMTRRMMMIWMVTMTVCLCGRTVVVEGAERSIRRGGQERRRSREGFGRYLTERLEREDSLFEALTEGDEAERREAQNRLSGIMTAYFVPLESASTKPSALLEVASTPMFDPASGLQEPTPECRNMMNSWMSECVFGSGK